jgi:hypothetical protein
MMAKRWSEFAEFFWGADVRLKPRTDEWVIFFHEKLKLIYVVNEFARCYHIRGKQGHTPGTCRVAL